MNEENVNNEEELNEEEVNRLVQVRKEKLFELQGQGNDPYEITEYDRTHTAGQIKSNYEEYENKDVSVAGRIIAKTDLESEIHNLVKTFAKMILTITILVVTLILFVTIIFNT